MSHLEESSKFSIKRGEHLTEKRLEQSSSWGYPPNGIRFCTLIGNFPDCPPRFSFHEPLIRIVRRKRDLIHRHLKAQRQSERKLH